MSHALHAKYGSWFGNEYILYVLLSCVNLPTRSPIPLAIKSTSSLPSSTARHIPPCLSPTGSLGFYCGVLLSLGSNVHAHLRYISRYAGPSNVDGVDDISRSTLCIATREAIIRRSRGRVRPETPCGRSGTRFWRYAPGTIQRVQKSVTHTTAYASARSSKQDVKNRYTQHGERSIQTSAQKYKNPQIADTAASKSIVRSLNEYHGLYLGFVPPVH